MNQIHPEMTASRNIPIVFIVDDDEAVRAALSLLVRSCGWKPIACASGGDFFAALASAWPACIVVNVQLPDMDGSTLQREISRLRMNLPVIVVTAYENHPRTVRAVLDGATAVIPKPFRSGELMAAIARLVSSSGVPPLAPDPILHPGT